jgi:hypothetical protein
VFEISKVEARLLTTIDGAVASLPLWTEHNAAIYTARIRDERTNRAEGEGRGCSGAEGASGALDMRVDWHALHRVIDTSLVSEYFRPTHNSVP